MSSSFRNNMDGAFTDDNALSGAAASTSNASSNASNASTSSNTQHNNSNRNENDINSSPGSQESQDQSYEDDDDEDDLSEDSNHLPFFADATLDMIEAQGIAPTPDLTLKALVSTPKLKSTSNLTIPNLSTVRSGSIGSGSVSNVNVNVNVNVASITTDAAAAGMTNNGHQDSINASHLISNLNASLFNTTDTSIPISIDMDAMPLATNTLIQSSTSTAQQEFNQRNSSSSSSNSSNHNPSSLPRTNITSNANAAQGESSNIDNATFNNFTVPSQHQPTYRPRPPRRPRDTKWTTAFLLSLPFLFLPSLFHHHTTSQHSSSIESSKIPLIATTIAAILFSRVFYLSRGGGEGEDQRYLTSQILIVSNISTCFILPLLTITFYNLNISTQVYNLIVTGLAYLTARDIYIFAKLFQSNRSWMREGVNDGERAFYRMIVNASLDILSRSLRSKSFYRVVVFVLLVQMMVCFFLKSVLEHALESSSGSGREGGGLSFGKYLWLGIVSVMGYWVVNVLIRVLGYLACGGVTAWFAQQSSMMEDMESMRRRETEEIDSADVGRGGSGLEGGNLDLERMPEAYRAVDASAYSLGIEFDEGMDDDYGDEDGILMGGTDSSNGQGGGGGQNGSRSSTWGPSSTNTSTVKAFLKSAFGVSFGSIVHCALLGGVASFTWSMLSTIDWIMSSSLRLAPFRLGTFRGMRVGDDSDGNGSMSDRLLANWQRAITISRAFVRNHNDLALCHVAAYYKSYTRAANDVMILVNTSGECDCIALQYSKIY